MNVAQQRLAALDTWRAWATGADVGRDELSQITTLEQPQLTNTDPRRAALVGVIREWANDRNLELPTETRYRRQELDVGLEL